MLNFTQSLRLSSNIGRCELSDMFPSAALGLWAYAYMSGKSLVPMLQPLYLQDSSLTHQLAIVATHNKSTDIPDGMTYGHNINITLFLI